MKVQEKKLSYGFGGDAEASKVTTASDLSYKKSLQESGKSEMLISFC